jgi:hypothetical protein
MVEAFDLPLKGHSAEDRLCVILSWSSVARYCTDLVVMAPSRDLLEQFRGINIYITVLPCLTTRSDNVISLQMEQQACNSEELNKMRVCTIIYCYY